MPSNMILEKITLRPGLFRDNTDYSNEGGWYVCNNIRFRSGFPEKIGGWAKVSTSTYVGTASHLHNWIDNSSNNWVATFTDKKVYLSQGSAYYDITPLRSTTAAGDVTFAAVNGSTTLTVTDTAHGALAGDYVTFSGAVSLGGVITAAVLNIEYVVVTVPSSSTYTITSAVAANASDSGNGGASVVGKYQIHVGPAVSTIGNGWSAGSYGRDTWGSPTSTISVSAQLRVWTSANFGEDLIFADRGGMLYHWVASTGSGVRAVLVTGEASASDVPTVVNGVFVTEQRQVVVFGCNTIGSTSLDPLFVRWSVSQSVVNWTPTATNDAGGYRLSGGSSIDAAQKTKQEVLLWTGPSLYSMQYLGGSLVYGFNPIEHNISLMGPGAVTSINNTVYWMGANKFYSYTGTVTTMDFPLWQNTFTNFNPSQNWLVVCGINERFNEAIWFYPSLTATTNDSYVIYNYVDKIWYYGSMARSAWLGSPLLQFPLAATYNNYLVYHESGLNDENGSGINAFIESSDFDLGDGYQFSFVKRLIPDLNFTGTTTLPSSVVVTLKARNAPGNAFTTQTQSSTITATTASVFTDQKQIRLRGRQVAIRVESTAAGVQWQLGIPRIEIQPDGRQ